MESPKRPQSTRNWLLAAIAVLIATILLVAFLAPARSPYRFLSDARVSWKKTTLFAPMPPSPTRGVFSAPVSYWTSGKVQPSYVHPGETLNGSRNTTVTTVAYRVPHSFEQVTEDIKRWCQTDGLTSNVKILSARRPRATAYGLRTQDDTTQIGWAPAPSPNECDIWVTEFRPTNLWEKIQAFFHR